MVRSAERTTLFRAKKSCFVQLTIHVMILTQDALDSAGVKVLEHLEGEPEVSQSSEEEQTLSGLLHRCGDMLGPAQVLRDGHPQIFEGVHSFHLRTTDDKGEEVPLLLPSVVHY